MTSSELAAGEAPRRDVVKAPPPGDGRSLPREAPPRPATAGKEAPPVIVKRPPPASAALALVCWVLSLMAGAAAAVYLFVIRVPQLDEITAYVAGIAPDRAEATHETTAEILFWCLFGGLVAVVLAQIVFVVSFTNRRPGARWYLFGSTVLLAVLYFLGREMVTRGDRGEPVELLLVAQMALLALGLLLSVLPGALKWTARGHDVRRGAGAGAGAEI
ncbi:hypothetical protein JOD63_002208 [Microbacterium terrae]|uniref:Uncharacterized protein n=1 Tax=Microbacterium terrae TaxID=69369 RepID=A0A0M2H8K9_9MICO|nr:hypothetical protein [Microbacterium terrae]KJL40951.1 hypothetical protein RS81_01495 [Microbacterium terrae]MBP1078240.1 hypothetical protein [Microbacterium terrae]GLJ97719.1 hypothetical protein GCM10017594_09160 [Microbacterium terrae]